MNTDRLKAELSRLRLLSSPSEKPEGIGTIRFVVRCPRGAADVLKNGKGVLEIVASNSFLRWPDEAEWRRLLPESFVEACAAPPSQEEAEQWLRRWHRLSLEEQAEAEANKDWPLDSWLYWMKPENRQWMWWDGQVVPDCDHLLIAVEVDCWPFPWGALRWLFKASGASAVEPES